MIFGIFFKNGQTDTLLCNLHLHAAVLRLLLCDEQPKYDILVVTVPRTSASAAACRRAQKQARMLANKCQDRKSVV